MSGELGDILEDSVKEEVIKEALTTGVSAIKDGKRISIHDKTSQVIRDEIMRARVLLNDADAMYERGEIPYNDLLDMVIKIENECVHKARTLIELEVRESILKKIEESAGYVSSGDGEDAGSIGWDCSDIREIIGGTK